MSQLEVFPSEVTETSDVRLRPAGPTLLVGAGKLAAALAPQLTRGGASVIAVRRRWKGVPPHVTAVTADVTRPFAAPLPLVDSMVITLPPSAVPDGYRKALENLREALPAQPSRTVFVSSTSVYEGWTGGQPITEADEPFPRTERAWILRQGEIAAYELFGAIIVRPAGIYGPGRDFLVRAVLEQRTFDTDRLTHRIHEHDLVRVLMSLLTHSDPPRVVNAVDGDPVLLSEVLAYISGLIDAAAPAITDRTSPSPGLFDGSVMRHLVGHLQYANYREGYAQLMSHASATRQ